MIADLVARDGSTRRLAVPALPPEIRVPVPVVSATALLWALPPETTIAQHRRYQRVGGAGTYAMYHEVA